MDKALNLLSLAKKGGNIIAGEEQVGMACRHGKVRLLVVAADTAGHTARRADSWAETMEVPLLRVPFSREEMGEALGKPVCALAGLTERKLAAAFVRALPASAQDQELLAQLERRSDRRKHNKQQLEVAE
jgi:ribosomal protein L7Ae-like RNA K-turn-binding protein